jgi:hypothetical protein
MEKERIEKAVKNITGLITDFSDTIECLYDIKNLLDSLLDNEEEADCENTKN